MGLGLTRTLFTGTSIPVWQGTDDDIQLVQGGCVLDITGLTAGIVIPMGTPMIYDTNRVARPIAVGTISENASSGATTYRVPKGLRFAVGQNFAATVGGAAYPITGIVTTDPNFDAITVGTTIGALNAGAFVFASSATGATAGAFGGVNGLLYEERAAYPGESCSIVIRGTCYARRVPYSADLDTALRAANCHIIYSQSL